jgi:hypothetical protein
MVVTWKRGTSAPRQRGCPRFASVVWTLTWEEEDPGRAGSAGLLFPIPGCPFRLDLYPAGLAQRIVPVAAPFPVFGIHYQATLQRISVQVA